MPYYEDVNGEMRWSDWEEKRNHTVFDTVICCKEIAPGRLIIVEVDAEKQSQHEDKATDTVFAFGARMVGAFTLDYPLGHSEHGLTTP